MLPITDPERGAAVLRDALRHIADSDIKHVKNLGRRVREGACLVWLLDKNTVMVASVMRGTTLFIDLVVSTVAGAIAHNFDSVVSYMKFVGLHIIACKPIGKSQERLYRRFGFEKPEGGILMTYDCKKHGVIE